MNGRTDKTSPAAATDRALSSPDKEGQVMEHRQQKLSHEIEPAWVTESVTFHNDMIDRGLINGQAAMARTPGLYFDPMHEADVLALALRRALTAGIPLSATIGDVLDRQLALAEGQASRVA